ncbi:MAG: hypothetical protein R2724_27185 [Bryobacterales bacterium]
MNKNSTFGHGRKKVASLEGSEAPETGMFTCPSWTIVDKVVGFHLHAWSPADAIGKHSKRDHHKDESRLAANSLENIYMFTQRRGAEVWLCCTDADSRLHFVGAAGNAGTHNQKRSSPRRGWRIL